MTTITTQRHLLKFYLSITLGTLFFLILGLVLIFVFFKSLNEGEIKFKMYFLPFLGLGTIFFAFYTVYKYFKNAPEIRIDNLKIEFNEQPYYWTDLKSIELTGKRNFPYLLYYEMEATQLIFENGQEKLIFDDMYSNTWQIKTYLQEVIINKQSEADFRLQKIESQDIAYEHFEIFKGNQFTSFRGITLWIPIVFFVYMLFSSDRTVQISSLLIFGFFGTFWFSLHSYLMHYFEISDKFFVVKNHNFIWTTKIYALKNIKEIVFETQGKAPNCLRVITKDFKTKLYPAGTLRDKTWHDLQDRLESCKIKVRNECV